MFINVTKQPISPNMIPELVFLSYFYPAKTPFSRCGFIGIVDF